MNAQLKPLTSYRSDVHPSALADIYHDQINIAIWQRELDSTLQQATENILRQSKTLNIVSTVSVDSCVDTLHQALGHTESAKVLTKDIHFLVDMYCCLFELERIGLRIAKLDRAMCPKFHVDRVPARLVTTYQGNGTEWLQNQIVDRTKLGVASVGIPDDKSGVYQSPSDVQQLTAGDVVLLKGESWIGNEGNGIVHRSPRVPADTPRLVVTFDFSSDE